MNKDELAGNYCCKHEQLLAIAVEALTEIRTFPRKRMPADIANEALAQIKEMQK